jgi:hypothetical protein
MSRTELLQRAIHSAKCRIYRINYDLNCDISLIHQKKAENQKELMEITVEALEKQIPKKVKMTNDLYPMGICPCCENEFIPHTGFEHCHYCGQALDWSDRE